MNALKTRLEKLERAVGLIELPEPPVLVVRFGEDDYASEVRVQVCEILPGIFRSPPQIHWHMPQHG